MDKKAAATNLYRLAQRLDKKGLKAEADLCDKVLKSFAQVSSDGRLYVADTNETGEVWGPFQSEEYAQQIADKINNIHSSSKAIIVTKEQASTPEQKALQRSVIGTEFEIKVPERIEAYIESNPRLLVHIDQLEGELPESEWMNERSKETFVHMVQKRLDAYTAANNYDNIQVDVDKLQQVDGGWSYDASNAGMFFQSQLR